MADVFKSHGVLSATTGILMGEIAELYRVASYLLDRPAFTHELALYSQPIKSCLLACHPELPDCANGDNFRKVLGDFVSKYGEDVELDPVLKGVLADDKSPRETLIEMGADPSKIIGI